MAVSAGRDERLRRYWNKHAGSYDRQMGFADRHFFGDSRHTGSVRRRPARCWRWPSAPA
jgi:hypothetical protein